MQYNTLQYTVHYYTLQYITVQCSAVHYRLLVLESDWVPAAKHSSLYIRPVMIGTEPTIGLGN